jgi:RNase adapter protein RapZ
MNIVIITGMSGAGKSFAAKYFEDMGYYCVDNMPPNLILPFIRMPGRSEDSRNDLAFVTDIRGGTYLNDLIPVLKELKCNGISYELLFLEADTNILVSRYKESRRMHPLAEKGDLIKGLEREKAILEPIREIADIIIDTSDISVGVLREKIESYYRNVKKYGSLIINIISFGFKYGLPKESDLVFDVRFMKNPFYIDDLKELSGLDKAVRDYVLDNRVTAVFLSKTLDLLYFLIPKYIDEGKKQLVIGIGCTGGRHRSIVISDEIGRELQSTNYSVFIEHRDINRSTAKQVQEYDQR